LGAPVGSLLLANNELIKKARRVRKVFGGGMRQAGYLAAAGIYALENNIELLAKDHANASIVARALLVKPFVTNLMEPETNILIFGIKDKYTAAGFADYLAGHNVLVIAISATQVRMVFHLDITDEMIARLVELIVEM
jgi:threonine aldolase